MAEKFNQELFAVLDAARDAIDELVMMALRDGALVDGIKYLTEIEMAARQGKRELQEELREAES